jgi:hypothetical protein
MDGLGQVDTFVTEKNTQNVYRVRDRSLTCIERG